MEVVIVPSVDDVAELAAGIVASAVAAGGRRGGGAVLGLATGSSPLPTYRRLVAEHRAGRLSFGGAHAVVLDEYVGLPPGHPESYRAVVRRELVDQVDLDPADLHCPDVELDDLAAACDAYDATVTRLGVDVQLLGIGADGHIGFNEPGSSLVSRTRVKTLTDRTREDNARFFGSIDEVPRHVITQGLGTICDAAHLVMIATGAAKAAPIAAAVEGPVAASCPASVMQLHRHVTVLLDEEAAGGLRHGDYYRQTFAHKPAWQAL